MRAHIVHISSSCSTTAHLSHTKKKTGGYHDRGTFMKARTQSLAQASWLPDCATVNCAAELHSQRTQAAAAAAAVRQPQVIGARHTARGTLVRNV
jgi:hypothetical protein